MRTNIIIDDTLMADALGVSGFKTKKETVEEALKLLIILKIQANIRNFRGKLHWEDDLNKISSDTGESSKEKNYSRIYLYCKGGCHDNGAGIRRN